MFLDTTVSELDAVCNGCFFFVCQIKDYGLVDDGKEEEETQADNEESIIGIDET